MNQLTLTLNNIDEEYDGYDFDNALITAHVGRYINNTLETLKIGEYTVDSTSFDS